MTQPPLPFAQADDVALARLRGVITDVDDTLTRGGELEREALDALHQLRARGLTLIAITGRPLGMVETLVRLLPLNAAVGENGIGYFIREGHRVREGFLLDPERIAAAKTQTDRLREVVAARFPEVRITKDDRLRRCDLAWDIGEEDRHSPETIAALSALIAEHGCTPVVSSIHAHAQAEAWDKASGAQGVLREMGIAGEGEDWSRWLYIGDSRNDSAAFHFFPLSVGVANVAYHLPTMDVAPRYITEADRGRGFAEMAARIVAAKDGAGHEA